MWQLLRRPGRKASRVLLAKLSASRRLEMLAATPRMASCVLIDYLQIMMRGRCIVRFFVFVGKLLFGMVVALLEVI